MIAGVGAASQKNWTFPINVCDICVGEGAVEIKINEALVGSLSALDMRFVHSRFCFLAQFYNEIGQSAGAILVAK